MQGLAKSIVSTYGTGHAPDIDALSRIGSHGQQHSNAQRDLLVQLGTLKSPAPFEVEASVIKMEGTSKVIDKFKLSVFLPHDWFAFLDEHNLMDAVLGAHNINNFWNTISEEDPKLRHNPCKEVIGWKHSFVPFQFHGDAGPHAKTDSLMVNSMRSLLTDTNVDTSMLLLGAIPEACRASKKNAKTWT